MPSHPAPTRRHAPPALDRITFEPGKMGGRACMRGLRITVGTVVALLAEGSSVDAVLAEYPDLDAEDVRQALAYAAWLLPPRETSHHSVVLPVKPDCCPEAW